MGIVGRWARSGEAFTAAPHTIQESTLPVAWSGLGTCHRMPYGAPGPRAPNGAWGAIEAAGPR